MMPERVSETGGRDPELVVFAVLDPTFAREVLRLIEQAGGSRWARGRVEFLRHRGYPHRAVAFDQGIRQVRNSAASVLPAMSVISADGNSEAEPGPTEAESGHDQFTIAEAATLLGCSERRVRQLADDLGGRKVAGVWVVNADLVRDRLTMKARNSA